ncbi:hypothetical protein D3C74_458170 [compost metagenome]
MEALMVVNEEAPSRFSGMGVRNVHERIHRVFGEPYGIKLYSEEGLYTKVEVRFPRTKDLGTRSVKGG